MAKEYSEVVKKVLRNGLDDNFMLRGVAIRKELCDAIYRRDRGDILRIMEEIATQKYDGGSALFYARKLLVEFDAFDENSKKIVGLDVVEYHHLEIIEAFLLSCARISYSGELLFKATSMRESALKDAFLKKNGKMISQIEHIKVRASLTNLMISRDIPGMYYF